jgi:hypothetical protein
MERGPGSLTEALTGEHVSLSRQGNYLGVPTHNRLMLTLKIPDVTSLPLRVQLDSAACLVILFKGRLRAIAEGGWEPVTIGDAGAGRAWMYQRQVEFVTVGSNVLQRVMVMAPARNEENDSEGLLPTILFRSVYISHSGGFAIFNPVLKTTLAAALP